MAGRSRRLAATVTVASSYATTLLAVVKGLFFVPLYLTHFDLSTYGAFLASANVVGMLAIADIGVAPALYQRLGFFHGARDRVGFARVATAGAVMLLGAGTFLALAGLVLSPYVPGWINAPPAAASALGQTFVLTAVGIGATLVRDGLLAIPAAWQLPAAGATSRIGGQLLEIGAVLAALLSGQGVLSLGIGMCVGGLSSLAVALAWIGLSWRQHELPRPSLHGASFGWIFRMAVPTLFSRVASQIAANMEVTLIAALVNPAAAGIYGITERTFRLSQGFINPIAGSTISGFSHLLGEAGPKAILAPVRELCAIYSMALSVTIPLILSLNRDFVHLWVGPEQFGGNLLSLAVAVGAAMSTRVFLLFTLASAAGRIAESARYSAYEALFRVPLMAAGLAIYGLAGMAFAVALGYTALAGVAYPRIIRGSFELGREALKEIDLAAMAPALVNFVAAMLLVRFVPQARSWPALVGKALGFAPVFVVLALATSRDMRTELARRGQAILGRARRG